MPYPLSQPTGGLPAPRRRPSSAENRVRLPNTLPSNVLTGPTRRACVKCTEGKRKCDKASPECTRCQSYNTKPGVRNTDVVKASLFAYILKEERFDELFSFQEVDWRAVTDLYFQTSHYWIGIFNRAKIDTAVGWAQGSSSHLQGPKVSTPEAALLLVCIYINAVNFAHVVSGGVDGRIECPLYQSVKRKFKTLRQRSGQPPVELMQAGVLLAGYEFSHGDYVSAYASLSDTANMARKCGISPGRYVEGQIPQHITTEEEESRALWWGLFILEQLIRASQVIKELPCQMECPPSDSLLPPDISSGNNPTVSSGLPLSTPVHVSLKGFARRAQSAVLLHRALLWEAQWTEPDTDGMTRHVRHVSDVRTVEKLDRDVRDTLNALMQQTERCEEGTTIPSALPSKQPVCDPKRQIVAEPDEVKAFAAVSFVVRFGADLAQAFLELVEENPVLENVLTPLACVVGGRSLELLVWFWVVIPDAGDMFTPTYKATWMSAKQRGIGDVVLRRVAALRSKKGI